MSADQPPLGSPPPDPPPPGSPSANPYGDAAPVRRYHWALVLVGLVIGVAVWVVVSVVLVLSVSFGESTGGSGDTVVLVLLGLLALAAVGLVVWRRSRELGQGIILGIAVGMVVGAGLCGPILLAG